MTYEANVKLELEMIDMYESVRGDMLEAEMEFAQHRLGELKSLIDTNSEFIGECVAELREHLQGIKESL